MAQYIDKSEVVKEIKRRKSQFMSQADNFHSLGMEEKREHFAVLASNMHSILSFLDTLEVKEVDLTDARTDWSPSKKQMESLNDMLKYNIGVFDYQKFMEVNSLYEDLMKILDYETDRQK